MVSYLFAWWKLIFIHHEQKEGTRIKATWNRQSQWTEANGADKAACQQRPAKMASASSAVHIQPVTSTVDTNVMLHYYCPRVQENAPTPP